MNLIRNVMSVGFNFGITPWLTTSGIQNTLVAVGMLAFGFTATFFFSVKLWQVFETQKCEVILDICREGIGSIR